MSVLVALLSVIDFVHVSYCSYIRLHHLTYMYVLAELIMNSIISIQGGGGLEYDFDL